MANQSRNFRPLSLNKDGECPGDHLHFAGVTRLLYKYYRYLAEKHDGFVNPLMDTIIRAIHHWDKEHSKVSLSQACRAKRMFIEMGILIPQTIHTRHGAEVHGHHFQDHAKWTAKGGGFCEIICFEKYLEKSQLFMGNAKKQPQIMVSL